MAKYVEGLIKPPNTTHHGHKSAR